MEIISIDRLKKIKEEAQDREIRQNIKSHCTKIRDGIQKNGSTSAQRAIWELFQNAGDQDKEATIRITLTADSFVFAHKGRSFDYDSLLSLVKQVSAQEKEGNDTVGQYGTGFLTTHTFSRKIKVTGSMLIDKSLNDKNKNIYVNIDDFIIDREFDTIPEFIDKMAAQIKVVNALLDSTPTYQRREWTELRYMLNNEGLKKAQQAIDEAIRLMPYVLTFNDKIAVCEICDNIRQQTITFRKQQQSDENELHCTRIIIEDNDRRTKKDCYYLSLHGGKDRILLPLETPTRVCELKNIPRLFVYYPLIGSENLGVNFLFHSGRFTPEEPRDTIILPKDNDVTKKTADENATILKEMTVYLWQYLASHVSMWENTIKIAVLNIKICGYGDDITDRFFTNMKQQWVDFYTSLPMIDTPVGRKAMADKEYPKMLEHSILEFLGEEEQAHYLSTLYLYAQEVALLPYEKEIIEWSNIIHEWGNNKQEYFISLDTIVQHISKNKDGDLYEMLRMLVEVKRTDFFNAYALLPNREQVLCKQSELRNAESITEPLYQLVQAFAPKICEKMADPMYIDLVELSTYTRANLREELNTIVRAEEEKCWGDKLTPQPYKGDFEKHLIALCSAFTTQNGESKRNLLMPIICQFENIQYEEQYIPAWPSDEKSFDLYRNLFLSLVENQMMKIEQKDEIWVRDNMELLVDFVKLARGDDYKSFCTQYALYPNQLNVLNIPTELVKNQGVDEELRKIYEEVLHEDLKSKWVNHRFETFFDFAEQTPQKVASEIQSKLQEEEYANPQVLNIIEKIDGKNGEYWAKLFSTIASSKEKLFFDSVTENNKRHVYSLMKVRDESILQKLANLAHNEKIDRILELGYQALQAEMNEAEHKRYINELGLYVEYKLLDRLKDILENNELEVVVTDEQGGQDFIVRIGDKEIYYIEVKSRWSKKDSVEMSPLQLDKCVKMKHCYSLCFVDMSWKNVESLSDRIYDNVDTCIKHTKCIRDIGILSEECIGSVKESKVAVHIGGSYTLVVPQKVIESHGCTFDQMIKDIENIILRMNY